MAKCKYHQYEEMPDFFEGITYCLADCGNCDLCNMIVKADVYAMLSFARLHGADCRQEDNRGVRVPYVKHMNILKKYFKIYCSECHNVKNLEYNGYFPEMPEICERRTKLLYYTKPYKYPLIVLETFFNGRIKNEYLKMEILKLYPWITTDKVSYTDYDILQLIKGFC